MFFKISIKNRINNSINYMLQEFVIESDYITEYDNELKEKLLYIILKNKNTYSDECIYDKEKEVVGDCEVNILPFSDEPSWLSKGQYIIDTDNLSKQYIKEKEDADISLKIKDPINTIINYETLKLYNFEIDTDNSKYNLVFQTNNYKNAVITGALYKDMMHFSILYDYNHISIELKTPVSFNILNTLVDILKKHSKK